MASLAILAWAFSVSGSALAQSNLVGWWVSPVPVEATNVVTVAVGFGHILALRRDGTPVGWGNNQFGQNNVPAGLTNVVAISAPPGGSYSLALKSDGRVSVWPTNYWPAIRLPSDLTNAAAVAAGADHALAVRTDGSVTVWGNNYGGQLDLPPGVTNVVAVAAGQNHSLALKADGTVVAWGQYSAGQTYVPFDLTNAVAIAAGGYQSVALRADGTVVTWGQTGSIPPSATNIVAIAAGNDPVIALKPDGTLTSWGINTTFVPPGLSNVTTMVYGLAVVGEGPPYLITPLVSRIAYRGTSVYFRAEATGARPLNYQWQFNGTKLAGATGGVLALTNAQLLQTGVYTLIVSNALGGASNSAALTVIPPTARINSDSMNFTDGHFQFEATLNPRGSKWTLQASTNLLDWVNLYTVTSYGGTPTLPDPSTNFSRRFYRLQLKP